MSSKIDIFTYMKGLNDPESPYYVPWQNFEIKPFKGLQNGIQLYKGHLLPRVCRNLEVVKSMEVKPDDTFVVTYPKSGTHWVAEMCWLIQNNLEYEIASNEKFIMRVPFIELVLSKPFLDQMQSPRVFMTHYQRELLPDDLNKKAKVVYVARNPKDVLVSLYYFHKKIPADPYEGTFNDLFDIFVSGEIMYDAWWKHIDTFAELENIHFMHFEDLLEDPINETRRLAKFLGKELADEQIKELVDFCSFDKLRKNAAFEMKPPSDLFKNIMGLQEKSSKIGEVKCEKQEKDGESQNPKPNPTPKPKDHSLSKIFRKGQIGDWKNHFTYEMSKKMDEAVAANLKYKKPFKYEPTLNILTN